MNGRYAALLLSIAIISSGCGNEEEKSPPGKAPSGPVATSGDGYNALNWATVSGATGYAYYWSVVSGVTKSTGFRVSVGSNFNVHGGITNGTQIYYIVAALNQYGEGPASEEFSAQPIDATPVADPLYALQWNLKNTGQDAAGASPNAVAGEDINVKGAWAYCGTAATCRGEGIRVAVVDDGLEIFHEDLIANVVPGRSRNYISGNPTDPSGPASAFHGTAVASIIGARDLNGKGLRGVAPRAQLIGRNMLQNQSLSNIAHSLSADASEIAVSNNSWGATDGNGLLYEAGTTIKNAIENGIANGRAGKGIVYVWSAGNGGQGYGEGSSCGEGANPICIDNSNYDGLANHHGVIAVGAVDATGIASSYSESGANILVSAPGGNWCRPHSTTPGLYSALAVVTADGIGSLRGLNPNYTATGYDLSDPNYTQCMNGTSAAAPHVSGVAALVIQANPALTWREVRWILAESADQIDPGSPDWVTNEAGLTHHHKYGFGRVNAAAATTLARSFTGFPTMVLKDWTTSTPNAAIPDNSTAVEDTVTVSSSGILDIEFVEVKFRATHSYSGDLEIKLTNMNSGVTSVLAETHFCEDHDCKPYDDWVFGSVRHLGEAANGSWKLTVADKATGDAGTLNEWKIRFYGK